MATAGASAARVAAAAVVVAWAAHPASARAQADARQALVNVSVSPETVTVGDRFSVRIRVRAPKVATITFPEVPSSAGGMEAADPRAIEDGPAGDVLDRTAVYTFVAWDVGRQAPQFGPVTVAVAGRERLIVPAPPPVVVRSVLPADTTGVAPRDARAPVPLPGTLWRYVLLATMLAVGILWYWWRRRTASARGDAQQVADAWERARDGFASLERLGLADAGEPGRHVIAHVDVLRDYLVRRVPAVSRTLDADGVAAALQRAEFAVPVERITRLLDRDASLRYARERISVDESVALAGEARAITTEVQRAHEARMRAIERPPRPRRR